MVEPRVGVLMPTSLEREVGVLARVRSNFGKPLGFHVVKLLLIHKMPKHCHVFSGVKASFNKEDIIRIIFFNVEVLGYKLFLDQLDLPPRLFVYTATPNLTSI